VSRYTLRIPCWRPALINELLRSVKDRIRRKKHDRSVVWAYAYQAKIPPARGRRRVSLHVTLGRGMKRFDEDAWQKSGLDALKHAKLIVDDTTAGVEIGSLTFDRDPTDWGSIISLEDLSSGDVT
jgi:hypothetical protein